uniref:Ig-like domain-containing protein n=1 Tax=Timema shepardi TaxID=629360 RepID=A0A7R9AKK0_TIMSH|nr:unnamed protein product [Timema shepardi]
MRNGAKLRVLMTLNICIVGRNVSEIKSNHDTKYLYMLLAGMEPRLRALLLLVLLVTRVSAGEQRFAMEPQDQTAIVGSRVTLPCRVINKTGVLQWTKDDFGLGTHRNLSGFDRYSMIGSDEEECVDQKEGVCHVYDAYTFASRTVREPLVNLSLKLFSQLPTIHGKGRNQPRTTSSHLSPVRVLAIMSSREENYAVFIMSGAALVMAILCKKRKRWWLTYQYKKHTGMELMMDLKSQEISGQYNNFTRLSPSDFKNLLQKTGSQIPKQKT